MLRGLKGTGKGTLGRLLLRIFRHHALQVTQQPAPRRQLQRPPADSLFLFVDEAFWAGDKQGEGVLKGLITEPTLMIEPKGLDAVHGAEPAQDPDGSNADWVVPASADERRYFVLDVTDTARATGPT